MIRRWLLALCIAAIAPQAAAAGNDQRASADTLTVVTFNLYHDRDHWPAREPLVVAGLRALRPDVIALQEVIQRATLPNQAQTLADALGYEMHFVSVDPPDAPQRYGNAILTRHPILARSERRLRPFDDARTVAHLRIALGKTAVNLYATHLHHTEQGGALRERQLRDVLAHVAATADGAASLLLGDFNAASDAPELRALDRGFMDVFARANPKLVRNLKASTTLNPHYFPEPARIDHVFAQRGRFRVLESRLVLNRAGAGGAWPSDHFGVHARVRVLPSPPNPVQ